MSIIVTLIALVLLLALVCGFAAGKEIGRPSCYGDSASSVDSVPLYGLGPPHVRFVDKQQSPQGRWNYLFRGGNPDITKDLHMNFGSLVKQVQIAANKSQVILPADVYFVDVNLLNLDSSNGNNLDETRAIQEFAFFKKNPQLGEFVFWESVGTPDNATEVLLNGKGIRPYLIQNLPSWAPDNLVGRMELLRQMLTADYGKSAIIYGHCDCGCDRTGQLFGSYYLRWLNFSWEATNKMNTEVATRPMGCSEYRNMQWYCLWLRDVKNFTTLDCDKNYKCIANI